jgi:MFS family permease
MRSFIWKSPDFLRLWSAGTVSDLGSQVTELALPLTAILILHATPFQIGVLGAARALPYLVVGLAAGVLVDRSRSVPLLVGTDLGRAVILGSIPIAYAVGQLHMPQLYVVAFAAGGLTVLFGVAEAATIHAVAPRQDLIDANSKMAVSNSIASVAGPGLGGVLIGALSAPVAILVDAISFLLSAAVLIGIRTTASLPKAEGPRSGVLADVKEGLSFILRHQLLRALVATLALMNLFYSVFFTAYLLYAVRVLHLSPFVIGVIFAIAGLAGLAGAAAAPPLGTRFGVGSVIVAGVGISSLALLLIPIAPVASPIPWLVAAESMQVFGLLAFSSTQLGLRQTLTPARLQGRMTASMRFLIQALTPVGAIVGGILGSLIGLHATLWIGAVGSLLALVPLLIAKFPAMRTIPNQESTA